MGGAPKHRRGASALPLLLALLLTASFASLQPAGTAQASPAATPQTLVGDPAGDQAKTSGPLVVTPPAFDQVDLRAVQAVSDDLQLTLTVTTTAAVTAGETVTLRFTVDHGPTSLANSTATGKAFVLTCRGGSVTGAPGATSDASGTSLRIVLPYSSLGAVGGDVIGNLSVDAIDTDGGNAPPPVTQDDSSATDRAPDTGAALPYTLGRPPVVPSISLTVTGGQVTAANGTTRAFVGPHAPEARRGTVRFDVEVANTGLDADAVHVVAAGTERSGSGFSAPTVVVDAADANLAAGAKRTLHVTIADHSGDAATTAQSRITATSTLGGTAQATVDWVLAPLTTPAPAPAEHKAVPAALGFLTPIAEGLHLDSVLGNYAELVLLLFFLLVAVALVFLAMVLVRSPYVHVSLSPKHAIVAPGAMAEFRVEVQSKAKFKGLGAAVLRVAGAPFRAGLQLGRDRKANAGESMEVPLDPDAHALAGTLRVQVPENATDRDRQTVEFDVTPLDADGVPMAHHRGSARVTIQADPAVRRASYASPRDIQLTDVRHDPMAPRAGAVVTTTATIHNDSLSVAPLRVVLQLDGHAILEERIEVPPRSNRTVQLPWTAGAGHNQVKVQVFLA